MPPTTTFTFDMQSPAGFADFDEGRLLHMSQVAMAKTKGRKQTASAFQRFAKGFFRPRRLCLLAVVLTSLISLPYLRGRIPDLRTEPEYSISRRNILVTPPPPWVPQDIVQQACSRAGLPETMSLLDKGLVRQVADAFAFHPWIKSVHRVAKQHPAAVLVEVTYRRPVGLVEVPEGLYPVDEDGVVLPPRDFSPEDVHAYPIITRVRSAPAGSIGQPWGDPAVLGAAQLAAVLTQTNNKGIEYWRSLDVSRIETPNRIAADDTIEDFIYRLHSPGGSRIIWGRAPGTGHPGEVSAEKKIRRLEEYLADYGGYETAHGPSELDIRHWHEISHRALATTPGHAGSL